MKYLLILFLISTAQADIIVNPSPLPSDYNSVTVRYVQNSSTQLNAYLTVFLNDMWNRAWNDPNHLPPAFFNALGTNCAQAMTAKNAEAQIINAITPNAIPSDRAPVTLNQDGTCTVVLPSPSPSPSSS